MSYYTRMRYCALTLTLTPTNTHPSTPSTSPIAPTLDLLDVFLLSSGTATHYLSPSPSPTFPAGPLITKTGSHVTVKAIFKTLTTISTAATEYYAATSTLPNMPMPDDSAVAVVSHGDGVYEKIDAGECLSVRLRVHVHTQCKREHEGMARCERCLSGPLYELRRRRSFVHACVCLFTQVYACSHTHIYTHTCCSPQPP